MAVVDSDRCRVGFGHLHEDDPMLQRHWALPLRRGVVLILVLMLLTPFAGVGSSFALYAQATATSARFHREAESIIQPDIDPELLLA